MIRKTGRAKTRIKKSAWILLFLKNHLKNEPMPLLFLFLRVPGAEFSGNGPDVKVVFMDMFRV
jgi:hypothetical protein